MRGCCHIAWLSCCSATLVHRAGCRWAAVRRAGPLDSRVWRWPRHRQRASVAAGFAWGNLTDPGWRSAATAQPPSSAGPPVGGQLVPILGSSWLPLYAAAQRCRLCKWPQHRHPREVDPKPNGAARGVCNFRPSPCPGAAGAAHAAPGLHSWLPAAGAQNGACNVSALRVLRACGGHGSTRGRWPSRAGLFSRPSPRGQASQSKKLKKGKGDKAMPQLHAVGSDPGGQAGAVQVLLGEGCANVPALARPHRCQRVSELL